MLYQNKYKKDIFGVFSFILISDLFSDFGFKPEPEVHVFTKPEPEPEPYGSDRISPENTDFLIFSGFSGRVGSGRSGWAGFRFFCSPLA